MIVGVARIRKRITAVTPWAWKVLGRLCGALPCPWADGLLGRLLLVPPQAVLALLFPELISTLCSFKLMMETGQP